MKGEKMHLQKDIMNILDKTGFNCVEPTSEKGKYNIYINSRTPFNSDFGFYVVYDGSFRSFKKAVSKICYAFDIDKDAEKRIPIRGSASIQTVLDESKWKKEKLDELLAAFETYITEATFTFTVSKLAGYIVDSICKKYITEYDFTVLDDAEPQISSWYGIKNINTGFNSSCIELFADYYGGGCGVYNRIDEEMDREERVDIIEKMILLVMKQEVCDENTKPLVQLSY